jgi:hypothetical protein
VTAGGRLAGRLEAQVGLWRAQVGRCSSVKRGTMAAITKLNRINLVLKLTEIFA